MASSNTPLYSSKLSQGAFSVPSVTELGKSKKQVVFGEVNRYVGNYLDSHAEDGRQAERETALKSRKEHAKEVATNFYSLATDFYEYGYGHSFHFAPIFDGKTLTECIAIYEHGVAKTLKAKPGMKLLVSPIYHSNSLLRNSSTVHSTKVSFVQTLGRLILLTSLMIGTVTASTQDYTHN